MRIPIPRFGRLLRSLEQHLASQAVQREGKVIAAHMATINTSLGKPSKRRKECAESMPYRLHIAIAFASLASALFSLYWWYP
ncbi:hypothetical protein [Janthinobacterium sp.]|uniref:hypothetical protein n=1 Tax=Janthinobacterium sp. TaxID=1871054 RepID=UPI002634DA4D|nr:hypothetical protein [Janthinobacterium sp.]